MTTNVRLSRQFEARPPRRPRAQRSPYLFRRLLQCQLPHGLGRFQCYKSTRGRSSPSPSHFLVHRLATMRAPAHPFASHSHAPRALCFSRAFESRNLYSLFFFFFFGEVEVASFLLRMNNAWIGGQAKVHKTGEGGRTEGAEVESRAVDLLSCTHQHSLACDKISIGTCILIVRNQCSKLHNHTRRRVSEAQQS